MKIRILLLIGVVAAIFCTCDPDGDSRVVGDVFTDSRAVLGYVDSFSLKLSTVRLDSFITSGNTDIFMGYCKDEKAGNVSAETYIPIVFSTKTNIPDDAEYDSLIICFKPKGGWVGDTLKPKEVKIYEVLEEIRPRYYSDQQQMFNHIQLKRSDTELATVTIDPFPKRRMVSWAHLSDSLGRKWFEMVRDGDDAMDKTEYFLDYFKGICIVPQTTDCTWGLDFVTSSTGIPESRMVDDVLQFEIRLCYHKPGDDELGSYMTFVPKTNSYQYVYFGNDRSGTPFDTLQIDGGQGVFVGERARVVHSNRQRNGSAHRFPDTCQPQFGIGVYERGRRAAYHQTKGLYVRRGHTSAVAALSDFNRRFKRLAVEPDRHFGQCCKLANLLQYKRRAVLYVLGNLVCAEIHQHTNRQHRKPDGTHCYAVRQRELIAL